MDSKLIRGLGSGALVVALSLLLPLAAHAQQRSGVEIWEATCGRCHMLQPTNKYYPKDWRSVGTHMSITARLTSAQSEAVIAFLVSGARNDATVALPTAPGGSRVATASPVLDEVQLARLQEYLGGLERASRPAIDPQ